MPGFFTFIENGLNSEKQEIKIQAIKAAGFTMAPEFIDKLLILTSEPEFSKSVAMALAQYGVEIIPFLRAALLDETKIEIQQKIPEIVEHIDSQRSVNFLFELLDSEDSVLRNKALVSLTRLKARYPFLHFDKKLVIQRILEEARLIQDTLSVLYLQIKLDTESKTNDSQLTDARKSLIELLERRLDGGLERIFRLLGLRFPPDEINSAFKSFQSNKSDIRISSIEFLDNLLDTRLKRVIIPLLETTILDSYTEEALKNLNVHVPDEKECYAMLLRGNDIKIKLAVLYLFSQLKDPGYLNLIEVYRENQNPKVRDFAEKAYFALQ